MQQRLCYKNGGGAIRMTKEQIHLYTLNSESLEGNGETCYLMRQLQYDLVLACVYSLHEMQHSFCTLSTWSLA